MNGVVIREARQGDAEGLVGAWRDAGRFAVETDAAAFQVPVEDGLAEWFVSSLDVMQDDETVLVAERYGEVLGFLSARVLGPQSDAQWQIQRELSVRRLLIDVVAISEPFRRQRVGTALVRAVEEWGRRRGAAVAAVDGNWENGVAVGFYEAQLGYRRRGLALRKALA
jgi:ribosomal protein S18 acetylase RimI-like enzyme